MTTETTNQLPPCPLTDCEGGEHHYHDIDSYAISEGHDCARGAKLGCRCYGPHRPQSPQWQPIECDQIRAGMRIMATTIYPDYATIPDSDAETVEIIAELLHAGDPGSLDMWGELTERERQNYRDQAREVAAAVRAHDEAV